MKKLSNTEAELKKSVAYKKMRVFFCEYNSFKLFLQTSPITEVWWNVYFFKNYLKKSKKIFQLQMQIFSNAD